MYILVDDKKRVLGFGLTPQTSAENWHETDSIDHIPDEATDERGILKYKFEDDKVVERTAEEMDADYVPPETKPTDAERITALENQIAAYEAAYAEGVQEA